MTLTGSPHIRASWPVPANRASHRDSHPGVIGSLALRTAGKKKGQGQHKQQRQRARTNRGTNCPLGEFELIGMHEAFGVYEAAQQLLLFRRRFLALTLRT